MSFSMLWSWVPEFDGQTLFSLVIGLIVSAATFWWGYKNTIGAKDERVRAANFELAAAVQKRIAIEREALTALQFEAIRRTKAYRAAVPERRLWPFGHILDIVLTDIFENSFIDKPGKQEIIQVLEKSRTYELEAKAKEGADASPDYSSAVVSVLAVVSTAVGAIGYLLTDKLGPLLKGIENGSSRASETLPFGIASLIAAATVIIIFKFVIDIYTHRKKATEKSRADAKDDETY